MTDLERKIHTINIQHKKGVINTELKDSCIEYLKIQEKYYNVGIKMADKFKEIVNPMIKNAVTTLELDKVKEYLRNMPECADKIFIFHSILIKEKDLK